MNAFCRKFGVLALAISLFTGSVRSAHAFIGTGTANPGLIIAGAVVLGAAAAGPAAYAGTRCLVETIASPDHLCSGTIYWELIVGYLLVSPILAALGVVLLPNSSGGSVQLAPLTPQQEDGLVRQGLVTPAQLQAYQDERAELESLTHDVARALRGRARAAVRPDADVDPRLLARWGAEEWSARKHAVSPEAFEAFSRMAAHGLTQRGEKQ